MRPRTILAFAAVVALAATVGAALAVEAAGRASRAPDLREVRPPATHLSGTGLYADGSSTVVRPGNLPFSPQYPLWSDGASKRRWIHVPPGTAIDASKPDEFEFPRGTKFWKEFSHAGRVETRLIERLADGTWRFLAYQWNDDGSDATLVAEDGAVVAAKGAPGGSYTIPSRNDCLACHEGGAVPVLGFSALQLSRDRDPLAPHAEPRSRGEPDLAELASRGIVRNLPQALVADPPRIVAATGTGRAALGYLHANCGHCHNESGAVAGIELMLSQSAADPVASARATLASLIGHASRFRAHGSTAASRIVPGKPNESVISMRMNSTNPLTRMPPLGVTIVDDAGLALVERWISQDLTPQPETTQ